MVQRQTESNAVILSRDMDLKLLFVVDSKSDSENTTFKIILFSKITSESTMALPVILKSIKGSTGITCDPEKTFEFKGEKYQSFAIDLYSGKDIGHAIATDESNKQLVINLAPTVDVAKGIHIIHSTTLTDNLMKLCIYARPEDVLNGYLYGGSTPDNKWFNFICEYFDWFERQHDITKLCRSDDMNYRLRMNKYLMKYDQSRNNPKSHSEEIKPSSPQLVRIVNDGRRLDIPVMRAGLTKCPIAVKTFKTPIQDQRLVEGDLEIADWIGYREIISINSVVSDNKLIRTIVVKNK